QVEPPDDMEAPDAPPSVSIKRATLSGVIVQWEPASAEDVFSYRVYRTGEDGETALLAEVPLEAGAKYVDKSVAAGDTYTYAVSAVDGALNESDMTPSEAVKVEQGIIATTFIVTVPDYTTEGDQVYIAGSFGTADYPSWNPGGLAMEQVDVTHWTITLDLPEGANVEYKFVRNGTWDAVEKGTQCEEIANRRLNISIGEDEDSLVADDHVVEKWRDLDACG
ncbi:MAG: hypothetical protein JW966_03855, partial [Anaerolineae bacterium]|nr:hypothetical protein [Anaerolineae bacterium]